MACLETRALLREASDHRPIMVRLNAVSHRHAQDEAVDVVLGAA
jgi:hypothetical protein